MKKRRKKYSGPKYISQNPISTVFGGMSGDHAEHTVELKIKNSTAMANLVLGIGNKDDWDRLVGAINMTNVLCEQGIGNEFRDQAIAAREALLACGMRSVRTGRFVFTGDEMRILNEAMECHEAQIDNVRAIDLDRAAVEVERRLTHRINSTSVNSELARLAAP